MTGRTANGDHGKPSEQLDDQAAKLMMASRMLRGLRQR
jgi:hypothetical protein